MDIKPYFDRDGITIYNGDCKQILPFLGEFDLLLTDPPYGIGEAKKNHASRGELAKARQYGRDEWDNSPPARWHIDQLRESCKSQILWGGNYFGLDAGSCWLVWDKDNGSCDFADCELAWTNLQMAVRKFKWKWQGMLQENMGNKKEDRVHPTQKPLALMRWCLSLVPNAETVFDPFMGSGTTLLAAFLEGRKAVGVEMEERYCEAAVKRLDQRLLF